jgi:scyllo-inositol 2-dehydrogenase (NADP+)
VDYFHLILDYGRLKVILHSGSLVRGEIPRFQIHGEKGSFIKYGLDPQEDQLKQGMAPGDPGYGVGQEELDGELTVEIGGLSVKGRVETLSGTYHAYYEGIVEAIRSGKPAPVTAEEARNVIKVIEYAMRSHQEKRAVVFE